jgi:hypothetical protein
MAGGGGLRRAMLVAPPNLAHLASADGFQARRLPQLPLKDSRHLSDSLMIDGQNVSDLQHDFGEAECATILPIRKRLRAIGDRRATEIASGTALDAARTKLAWHASGEQLLEGVPR